MFAPHLRKRLITGSIHQSCLTGRCAWPSVIAFAFRHFCRSMQGICRLALFGLDALAA
jgi:hypothetical protein